MSSKPSKPSALRSAVKGVLGTSVAVPLVCAALPAAAQTQQQTIQQLRAQMQQMQQRLNQLENQNRQVRMKQKQMEQKQAKTEESQVEPGQSKKGFEVAGTNFQLSGYIKLDAMYDFNKDSGASLGPSDAGVDTKHNPNTGFTAKQSRLNVATTTPTPYGDVSGFVQMDFYGSNFSHDGSYNPRVRLAYFKWNNFEFGKDWSTFSDFNYGTMLNFYGPQSQLFERHAQVRYTFGLANGDSLDLALENPDGQQILTGRTTSGYTTSGADEQFPDFVARYKGSFGNFNYQAAGLLTYIEANTGDGQDHTFGYGFDIGGSYALPTGTTFMLTADYGQGDAKYVYNPAGGPASSEAYVDKGGDLDTLENYGYIATISQKLSSKWTTNLVWGQGFSEDPDVSYNTDFLHKRSSTLAANLLYSPVKPLTFGVEYDRVMFTNQGGDHGNNNWMQFSAIYNF